MDFNICESLQTIDTSNWDFSKCSKMVTLDKMTFKQIEWCKKRGIIENLRPEAAKQLDMCPFYAIISSELIADFDKMG